MSGFVSGFIAVLGSIFTQEFAFFCAIAIMLGAWYLCRQAKLRIQPLILTLAAANEALEPVRQSNEEDARAALKELICPLLGGPKSMLFWTRKEKTNAIQETHAGGDYRQAA